MNTAEFLMIASSVVPERSAMVCGERSRAYAEMQERVNGLANALQAMGIGKGDKISVMALNSMEYVEIYYAGAKLGAVFVPLNYRAKQDELSYMCNNSETKVLFVGDRYLELADKIKPDLQTVAHTICIDSRPEGMPNLEDLIAKPEVRARLGSSGPGRARKLCDPSAQMNRLSSTLEELISTSRNQAQRIQQQA